MRHLLLILSLFIFQQMYSQHSVGIEAGVSSSQFRNNTIAENFSKRLTAATFGVFYEFDFNTKWSLKSVLSSQKKGFIVDDPEVFNVFNDPFNPQETTFVEEKVEYNFIVINPMIKYTTGQKTQFFVNVGPFYGLQTDGGDYSDAGITSGVGGQYVMESLTFSVEARNSLGLKNIVQVFNIENSRSNTYFLLAGVSYNL